MYEASLWDYLSDVFSFSSKASELGVTDDLIYRIVRFYSGRPAGCEVYAFNEDVNEFVRGADIDLFIEDNGSGRYYHFMLQAKIMNQTGRYSDIKKWSVNGQYYKLIKNARKENAMALYLFYNGLTANSSAGTSQFGVSISHAVHIKNNRLSHRRSARVPKAKFSDFHPANMEPFHVLFCTIPQAYKPRHTVARNDIYTAYPYKIVPLAPITVGNAVTNVDYENDNAGNAIGILKENNLAKYRVIIKSRPQE